MLKFSSVSRFSKHILITSWSPLIPADFPNLGRIMPLIYYKLFCAADISPSSDDEPAIKEIKVTVTQLKSKLKEKERSHQIAIQVRLQLKRGKD